MNDTKRIATVDIGTNSTRLLVCDITVDAGGEPAVTELERRSTVTRLGHGVDATGRLDPEARERVLSTLDGYADVIRALDPDQKSGVLTSAGRDAADGAEFCDQIIERSGIAVRLIDGDEEARLSFLGATSSRPDDGQTVLVCDVGGGSTEVVTGRDGTVLFHHSLALGVVRQTERWLRNDPPLESQLSDLAAEVKEVIIEMVPQEVRRSADCCIAVAGTATTLSAIDQQLEPYDPSRVHGSTVTLDRSREILSVLSRLPLNRRETVIGLHPDRAPTAVAGVVIICGVLEAFGLDRFEASEHDILRGEALRTLGF